jgi:tRNA A37 threonylcarbamoyladenosine biosynthesis protein TsaE
MFASQSLVIIEWAERVEGLLPAERLDITLEVTGETSRRAILSAAGDSLSTALDLITAGF